MAPTSSAKGKAKVSAAGSKVGAPSAKSGSRKSKASWRKAVDISEVEEKLEEKRTQERLLGSSAKGKDGNDGGFFTVDRTGDEAVAAKVRSNRAGKRPLKSLEILQSKSAVAPFSGRSRSSAKQAAQPSKAAKDKLRRLANKTVKGPLGGIVESEQSRLQDVEGVTETADRDIWEQSTAANGKRKAKGKGKASGKEEEDHESGEEWIDGSQRKPVKVPKTLAASSSSTSKATGEGSKPTHHEIIQLSRTLRAVAIPHPGQSYNPDVVSHEMLIQQAYEIEKVKEMELEALRRYKKQWDDLRASERDAILKDKASKEYLGMQVDVQGSDVEESDAGEDEEEDDAEAGGKKDPKRKTKAQRGRAKRAKEEQRAAHERKMLKQLRHLMTQLPSIRKHLQAEEKERTEALAMKRKEAEEKFQKQGMQGQKIGRNFVPTDVELNADQIQLGEDLTENLRALKTEGNLFRDRYQRLQTRALAEPRVPVVAKRRLGQKGRKEYETHSYKRFE